MQILDSPPSPPASKPIWGTVLRYGLFCGLALILARQFLYRLGVYSIDLQGLIANVLLVVLTCSTMTYFAIKRQRDSLDGGVISSSKSITVGICTILMGFLILSTWNYLFINFIAPDYLEHFKAQAIAAWQNRVSPEEMNVLLATLDAMKEFPTILLNSLSLETPLGVLCGVVVSLFMVRK